MYENVHPNLALVLLFEHAEAGNVYSRKSEGFLMAFDILVTLTPRAVGFSVRRRYATNVAPCVASALLAGYSYNVISSMTASVFIYGTNPAILQNDL